MNPEKTIPTCFKSKCIACDFRSKCQNAVIDVPKKERWSVSSTATGRTDPIHNPTGVIFKYNYGS